MGCFAKSGEQDGCIARLAALDAGWGAAVPGFTVNRYCGSGLTAVNQGVMGIWSGAQHLVVAGGVEKMSCTPSVSAPVLLDRKRVVGGKSVYVSLCLGGHSNIKQKNNNKHITKNQI